MTTPPTDQLALTGASVLTPTGLVEADVAVHGDVIAAVGTVPDDGQRIDLPGRWVLPGIVDLHGDAVERALSPRPSAPMPVAAALMENDRAMLAAGITTAYVSLTDGFEPGLRSRQRLREVIAAWRELRPTLGCDTRIHVRHERCNTEDLDELLGWIGDGTVELLSLNDHAPPPGHGSDGTAAAVRARTGLPLDVATEIAETALARRAEGLEQEPRLVEAAHAVGVPLASHDDADPEQVARSAALGVRIAEFPFTLDAAHAAQAADAAVLLGAPNLVRGGSHLGNLAVVDAVAAGAVDVLASDYHYPALAAGALRLVDEQRTDLATAWGLVAGGPARAVGLTDRGRIEAGLRADLVVIDPAAPVRTPELVMVGGRVVWSAAPAIAR
ncbi:MAG: alpha-D-ribose 1-methylphosphonate 5-triphosphate diphosphatase [Actinomycetota bacterium]